MLFSVLKDNNFSISTLQAKILRKNKINIDFEYIFKLLNGKISTNSFSGKIDTALLRKLKSRFKSDYEFNTFLERKLGEK